jgi:hypothetical protein
MLAQIPMHLSITVCESTRLDRIFKRTPFLKINVAVARSKLNSSDLSSIQYSVFGIQWQGSKEVPLQSVEALSSRANLYLKQDP